VEIVPQRFLVTTSQVFWENINIMHHFFSFLQLCGVDSIPLISLAGCDTSILVSQPDI
jgi:hypothetical protein